MTSQEQSKKMLEMYGEEAYKKALDKAKKAKGIKQEVFWKCVAYHLKTNKPK